MFIARKLVTALFDDRLHLILIMENANFELRFKHEEYHSPPVFFMVLMNKLIIN